LLVFYKPCEHGPLKGGIVVVNFLVIIPQTSL